MITLKTSELKKFLSQAAVVKPNILYPALENIKFNVEGSEVTMVKTNMNVFCLNTFDMPGVKNKKTSFTINEQALSAFVSLYNDEELTVTVTAKQVVLQNAKNKLSLPAEVVADFPTTPVKPDSTGGPNNIISPSEIAAIKTASAYISDDKNVTIFSHVHLGELGIFASNGNYVYYMQTEARLPEILLDEVAISIVTNMAGGALVTSSDNYNFFEDGDLMYAVIKSEFKTFDYTKVINANSEQKINLRRQDIVNFCTLVSSSSKQEWPLAAFKSNGKKDELYFEYVDADFGRDADSEITADFNFDVEPFNINIIRMNHALRALPYENITLTKIGQHYKITTQEDANYIGIISGIKHA